MKSEVNENQDPLDINQKSIYIASPQNMLGQNFKFENNQPLEIEIDMRQELTPSAKYMNEYKSSRMIESQIQIIGR